MEVSTPKNSIKRYKEDALTPLLIDSKINDKIILSNSHGSFDHVKSDIY